MAAVDAIGAPQAATSATAPTKAALDQEDFLKLFLTELNFQDPMEPLNNREFLAQMAQFASLEQSRATTQSMENLVFMSSTSQSVSLLGKKVELTESAGQTWTVTAVKFTATGPTLTLSAGVGNTRDNVKLSQVSKVQN